MNNEPRRQHFVPKTYLKHFSEARNGEYYIKALHKENLANKDSFELNIDKICASNNLYTLVGDSKEVRMLIENFYSNNIENHYDKIYDILTDDTYNKISNEERDTIISTVVTMLFRTPKMPNSITKFLNDNIRMSHAHAKKHGLKHSFEGIEITDENIDQLLDGEETERRIAFALQQLKFAIICIRERLKKDSIDIIKLDDERAEFITSDNPVMVKNSKAIRIAPLDPNNTLYLPIDTKHLLTLTPLGIEDAKNTIARFSTKGVMVIPRIIDTNIRQFNMAERFVLGTKKGLHDFKLLHVFAGSQQN